MSETGERQRVVIVGGGAGGLILATRLAKQARKLKTFNVTLVDENLTHIWKPLLHEIAAGSLNSYEDEMSYLTHAARHRYDFQLGRLQRIDREQKYLYLDEVKDEKGQVLIEARSMPYDVLVLAMGSTNNDFGTKGVKEHCFMLDNRKNAEFFHTHFLGRYLATRARGDAAAKVHLNIVGGGATGVELAGEVYTTMRRVVSLGFKEFDRNSIEINIIEASDNILAGQTDKVKQGAMRQLEKIGVKVWLKSQVKEVTATDIVIGDGRRLASSLCVWAAGIRCAMGDDKLDGLALNKVGQIKTITSLQTETDSDIFSLGDCAEAYSNGERLAPRAQVAQQQAMFLADNIVKHIKNEPLGSFVFHEKGSLISVGDSATVGQVFASVLGSFYIQGLVAKWAYVSLYRRHQVQTLGLWRTTIQVVKDTMTRVLGPKIKLH